MKLIKPSVEYIPQEEGLDGIYKHIEKCAKVCYKSECNITEDSAKPFVDSLIKAGHCYTGDCEVLTSNGWIKWKHYNNQKLAVVNPDLTFKGFETPKRVIRSSYKGKFYEFPAIGLKVTDGHRMFGVFRNGKNDFYNNNDYKLFTCDQEYIDANGRHKTLGERMFKVPRCCKTPVTINPFAELIGFWLGDGCHSDHKDKLVFHLKKERKIKYLKHLCNQLGYVFESGKGNYYRVVQYNIGLFFNDFFYRDKTKYIDTSSRTAKDIYGIILGLLNSDGSKGNNTNTYKYTTTSEYIKDWIEMYAPIAGFHVSIREKTFDNPNYKASYIIFFQTTKYTLNNDSRRHDTRSIITDEELDVYCATVSTGLLLVRGVNKVVSVCGNCAMLEHGTIYLAIPVETIFPIEANDWGKFYYNLYSKAGKMCEVNGERKVAATTSMRVIIENGWKEYLKYICEPTEYHSRRYSMKFVTDIGVCRELLRHRKFSFANESTRYCNYSKDKFGNEITFVVPCWYTHGNGSNDRECSMDSEFENCCRDSEQSYLRMIQWGAKPQEARQVLPLATKTEIVMTGFADDWRYFFGLRLRGTTGKPHPDMQYVAQLAWNEFKDKLNLEL